MNTIEEQMMALADQQFDGTAGPDQIAALEKLLAEDETLRHSYLRYAMLNGQIGLSTTALTDAAESRTLAVSQRSAVARPELRRIPTASRAQSWQTRITVLLSLGVALGTVIWISAVTPKLSTDEPLSVVASDSIRPNKAGDGLESLSNYDERERVLETVGTLGSTNVGPTTLDATRGETRFASSGGAQVRLTGPAMFGVSSPDSGVLYSGTVHANVRRPNARFSVTSSNVRIVDLGTEYQVAMLDDRHISVRVLDGEVDVQSRSRMPLFYWNFDTESDALGEISHNPNPVRPITPGSGARFVKGIIGQSAVDFDNTTSAYVQINEGTGEAVGQGAMAFSSGISIEAMFISRWTAAPGDYDEIFRKEDGAYRLLLSFQNDGDVRDFDLPEVDPGPCLSFGLHVEDHGYGELDMPLDGRDGRPTVRQLTDGHPHHVVATYDSFTGKKTIFIDGRPCFEYQYPVGRLILSGGPAPAEIGNIWTRHEPFNGIIDEVALYDFALTPGEIRQHYSLAANGRPYVDMAVESNDGHWGSVTLVAAGTRRVFNKLTGRPADDVIPH